ncbi:MULTISPECIES: bis(5'-nucleosyl)-tetraphosphatase PrpE [Paraliobacillus]|uniref:bis(5'-nucleosyl)-tetraphosphatase PrpE n=1 Tax=Paraliobacillus TaxID=200903 RepID=UPI000DD3A3C5|nr:MULTISPECIES: bis(5'-nucleosyl)-tetraphosphatase PrpE [Paraliobacillus]
MKFDVIGDVHGCYDELHALFTDLGYERKNGIPYHPDKRTPVFLGDITDRGPKSIKTIDFVNRIVMEEKVGRYVPGNHCNKLYRYFLGNNVQISHGLETTVAEFQALSKDRQAQVKKQFVELYEQADLYESIPEVNAIVAHAGIREDLIGRKDKETAVFVLYGDITGKSHDDGRPERRDWAQDYHSDRWIVYGHTPVKEARRINQTINIDTGCVFGNKLTAFRLPEETLTAVPSQQPYIEEKFKYFE